MTDATEMLEALINVVNAELDYIEDMKVEHQRQFFNGLADLLRVVPDHPGFSTFVDCDPPNPDKVIFARKRCECPPVRYASDCGTGPDPKSATVTAAHVGKAISRIREELLETPDEVKAFLEDVGYILVEIRDVEQNV